MMKVKCVGQTDVGLVRSNNEDAFLISEELGFAALADGIGGVAAGELASKFFVDAVLEVYSRTGEPGRLNPVDLLERSFELANQRILDHARENPVNKGLGCTADLLTFFGNRFALAHVGDSRTYLLRDQTLKLLTQDHSFVQELMNRGEMTAEEARQHPMRHVILRSIGQEDGLKIDTIHGELIDGDLLLLCSDGLTDMLDDSSIRDILSLPLDLDQRARKLIDSAKDSGGLDNITVVLCLATVER